MENRKEREFSLEETACSDPRVVNAGARVCPEGVAREKGQVQRSLKAMLRT